MFSMKKTRRIYQSPYTKVAEVDLEGLVCTSAFKKVQVDELHNMNKANPADDVEPFYFES